ncbi:MAG: 3-deoxy-D-manno-octulosonic acid transferase [Gemmatimonadaceae bacterium]
MRALYAAAAQMASSASAVVPQGASKLSLTFRARRGIRERYLAWAHEHRDRSRPLLWMHAPSVGEGLMARPILGLLRERHPGLQLAYTFFSPSAEEFSRTLDVDFREYLPFDAVADARATLEALVPRALVFSKLDVWPELVHQARDRGVRLGLISASLPPESLRRSRFGTILLRDAYAALDAVGAVDEDTAVRLLEIGVRPDVVVVTGDTRYDQVSQRAWNVDRAAGLVARLASERPTLVAGSTWPADERHLLHAFVRVHRRVPTARIVLAPHEVTPQHIEPIVAWAGAANLPLARVDEPEAGEATVILVDRYGILGDLYAVADLAFVGGGFHDAGLHSVLEPAAFGAPVLFGPRHTRSRDALELLKHGGALAVHGGADIERAILAWIGDPDLRRSAGQHALAVIERGRGAAERSLRLVEGLLE